MDRREALAIAQLWNAWVGTREIDNRAYRDFVFDVIGADERLGRHNVFEVLDAVVNAEAWLALGRPASAAASRGGPRDPAEHRARRQTRPAGVVEVEQTAH